MNQITPQYHGEIIDKHTAAFRREAVIVATMRKHPKRRGELLAEYERRILRLAREGK